MSSHLRDPVRAGQFRGPAWIPVETGAVKPILTDTHVSGFTPGRSADRHERTERSRRTGYLPSLPRPWPAAKLLAAIDLPDTSDVPGIDLT
jgi:hypothetical protein